MIRNILKITITVYQCIVSPFLGHCCRFYPTCSAYAYEAITKYGTCKGIFLALKRLLRCHPFNPGGVDLVP